MRSLLCVLLVGCATSAPAPTSTSPPSSPAPTPAPTASPPASGVVHGEGCTGSRAAEQRCHAQGPRCVLAALPRASRCAHRGARCPDTEAVDGAGDDAPCECTCSPVFRAAAERAAPPPVDADEPTRPQ